MIQYIFHYFREIFLFYLYSRQRKALEDEAKLDKYLKHLRGDEEEEKKIARVCVVPEASACVEYNCVKNEGTVTSLTEAGGVINNKIRFPKVVALSVWSKLKVGSKLSFLLYEGTVRSIELLEVWDESLEDNKTVEAQPIGYNTDIRTVIGTITKIQNEILTVEIGEIEELFVPLEEHPNLKWFFVEGDVLRLDCVIQEDEFSWNPTVGSFGKVLSVKSIKPNREKQEKGRVSAVAEHYAVIDGSVVVSNSSISEPLILWEEYLFEAIESSCMVDNRSFHWRLTKIIKKIDENENFTVNEHDEIQMFDMTFNLRHDVYKDVTKSVTIYNKSQRVIPLKSCEISSTSGLVKVDKEELNFELRPNTGKFNIFLKISPRQIGSFVEELEVDFGDFKKTCLVTVDVQNSNLEMKNRNFKTADSSECRELIPGQKIRIAPRFIDIRVKDYLIPDVFRTIDFKKNSSLVVHDLNEDYKFLFEELSRENYKLKLQYCLYLEEISMEIYFARYKIERGHFENKQEFLRLEVEGVAEKRPSLSLGDSVRAIDPFPSTTRKSIYEGIIHKVEQNAILLKFHADFHQTHGRKDFRIEFFFSRTAFKRQQHALEKAVAQSGLGYDFLFPKVIKPRFPQINVVLTENEMMEINGEKFKFFNENLNKYQKEAIVNVLRGECRPLPYIIYGPPGTGKTQTVVECIEQIASKIPSSRIIVAAPSNSAANLIVDRLLASGRFKGGDFIRFVSFNQIEKDLIPPHLKKYCATIDMGFDDGSAYNMTSTASGLRMNCSKSIIVQYKIYISTLSSLGPLMHIRFPPDHFTHVIIDEAGQTVETESLIPITFVSKQRGQVILAGDPNQLGPVLTSHLAKLCGFEKSLLERLSEHEFYLPHFGPNGDSFDRRFVTKLKKNYRSLPSILGIYNQLFYKGELEAEISEENSEERKLLKNIDEILWNRATADRSCGVYFVNVANGKNMRTVESSSWYNNEEASRVFLFVCKLKRAGILMKDVGIITPYALQVKNLKRIINESMPDCGLKIGTVEEFQGQERQIILVTTVRTNQQLLQTDIQFGLGFLQCKKRMNVAISRARALLVVFGKESILGRDDNWRHLIQFAKEKGTYVSM